MSEKGALPKFEMIAGHPALDFVNSLDDRFAEGGPVELLATYDDLLRFLLQAELISERQFRELKKLASRSAALAAVLAEAVELREALAAILYALLNEEELTKDSLLNLEDLFKQAAGHRKLVFQDDSDAGFTPGFVWKFKGVAREVESPVWLLAQSGNDLLISPQVSRLRKCASPSCQWLFLDTSKNHTRRWCDMKICGNRNKARLFHLRQAEG